MLGSCRYALGCCVGKYPPKPPAWLSHQPVPDFDSVLANSVESVRQFWEEGAFVDLARYIYGNVLDLESRSSLGADPSGGI